MLDLAVGGLRVERGGRTVLSNTSFTIPRGQWFGVLGGNGSGKTTLLKAIAGRLPVAAGQIALGGRDMAMDDAARVGTFGFASPIETLPRTLTAGEVLSLVGRLRDADWRQPAMLYGVLRIQSLLSWPVDRMSSGMKQRLALHIAFVGAADVVLLDEPLNWLDPVAAYDLKRALRSQVDSGRTVITAFHDLDTFTTCCDRGLLLANGGVSLQFEPEDLRAGAADRARFEARVIEQLRG